MLRLPDLRMLNFKASNTEHEALCPSPEGLLGTAAAKRQRGSVMLSFMML